MSELYLTAEAATVDGVVATTINTNQSDLQASREELDGRLLVILDRYKILSDAMKEV